MIALSFAGLIVGFVLGLRFTVFVLLPVEMAALAAAALVATVGKMYWGTVLLGFVSFGVCSQMSYALALALPALLRAGLQRHSA